MKMIITTDSGIVVHTLKYIEDYNLDRAPARSDIINFVREAQNTAKWFAERDDTLDYSKREREHLKGRKEI